MEDKAFHYVAIDSLEQKKRKYYWHNLWGKQFEGKKGGKIMIKDVSTEKAAAIQYSKRETYSGER